VSLAPLMRPSMRVAITCTHNDEATTRTR
jgi:hypothetical protein